MKITIYHNPRCGKSRQTLALLEARGVQPQIIEYLKTPPDAATLKQLLKRLGLRPRELLRSKEAAYREAGLDDPGLSDDAVIQAMLDHPILIERPIVVAGNKAVLGRPPENVLAILPA
jgi:arsenate reductase